MSGSKLDFVQLGKGLEAERHSKGREKLIKALFLLRRKHMPLPDPILEVLMTFRPLFTVPTWRKLMTLLTGTRLSQGRRTVGSRLAPQWQRHGGQLEHLPFRCRSEPAGRP